MSALWGCEADHTDQGSMMQTPPPMRPDVLSTGPGARPPQQIAPAPATISPIDTDTIGETIRKALQFGAVRPRREELAATDEALRGHVALLLAEARRTASPTPPDRYRLDRISKHMAFPLGKGMLSAYAEVPQRARDCQWLLAYFTASRDEYKPSPGPVRAAPTAGRRA